ncbi:hypothetical protein ACHAP3_008097 [Botrytis cinerea]
MEVYKSVYDLMLAKAISYGYVKEQVLDILSESHNRVELSTFKNIPDGEKYWMAERWAWETLCLYFLLDQLSEDTNILAVADESAEFPGEKPKWKRVSKYLKQNLPAAGETPKSTQNLGDKTSEVPISMPKRIFCVDTPTEKSSGEQVPKSATRLPQTSPTSLPSEKESKKRQKLTQSSEIADEKDLRLPRGVSTTFSQLIDAKIQKKKPTH